MSMKKDTKELIGRAVVDTDFRRRLLQDPEATIRDEGYEIDEEVLLKLKSVDPAVAEATARQLDEAFAIRNAAL